MVHGFIIFRNQCVELKNEGKETNESQLKYKYTQTQCEDGARDVRVLKLTPVITFNFQM